MRRMIFLLLLTNVFLWGCGSESRHHVAEEDSGPPVSVNIVSVERRSVPVIYEGVGSVVARTSTTLSAKVMGHIEEISVDEGDRVQRGQTVVKVDPRQPETQIRQAEARIEEANSALVEVERSIDAAQSGLKAAEANAELARATFSRFQELRGRNSVSQQEFDEVQARSTAAEAEVQRARDMLESARAKRQQVEARIVQAEAGLDSARLQVEYATVEAPVSGFVTRKMADVGQLASPGVPLLTIEDPRSYQLEVVVAESQLSYVQLNEEVEIRMDSLGEIFTGTVVDIVPAADSSSRSVTVKVSLPRLAGLKSGLFGVARFRTEEKALVAVPMTALVERGQLEGVYVIDGEGRARFRLVQTGKKFDGLVEVLSGLTDGEEVILNPSEGLRDGRKVSPTRTMERAELLEKLEGIA